MIAILINCITLGSYQPCYDTRCESNRCLWLKTFDNVIFLFFFMEMLVKMIAMGVSNAPQAYLADYWNRLDCFIVIAGGLEYILDIGNVNLSAIRTVRVLRPLRAINRIPSMRILVTLLLDTLPMLGNVLLLCFFVFFIFGIIGVQLWSGLLRQRCFISLPANMTKPSYVPPYYRLPNSDKEYLCSTNKDNGLHRCLDLPPLHSSDLTTLCQNTIPLDWQTPKPIIATNIANSNINETTSDWQNQHKYEDRYIEGELVPYDLVPGDEASPFLMKQMSPLIAQSVFQPAFAPRQFDSLPAIRQRRGIVDQQRNSKQEVEGHLLSKNFTTSSHMKKIVNSIYKVPPGQDSNHDYDVLHNSSLINAYYLYDNQNHQNGNDANVNGRQEINLVAKVRSIRVAVFTDKNLDYRKVQNRRDDTLTDLMVETNANSDGFESVSQNELRTSDKSNKKYFLRKKANKSSCINWNKYYTECRAGDTNPFQGTISFDNVGMAWTTIFLVISLEGWSDIMYLLQDSHSFWVWIYFVLLIVIGSFFMINLCLVVIATQFSATKKREMERMRQERLKSTSSSTITATSESTNCYTVIVKTIARSLRHAKIAILKKLKQRKCEKLHKQRLRERQKQLENVQITGIHSEDLKRPAATKEKINCNLDQNKRLSKSLKHEINPETKKDDCERARANLTESYDSGGKQISAELRRSSWRRSIKSAQKQPDRDTVISSSTFQTTEDLPQASGELLIKERGRTFEAVEVQGLKRPNPSQRKLIRMDQTNSGPSCRHASRQSKKGRGESSTAKSKALHSSCRHYHECDIEEVDISCIPKFIRNSEKLRAHKIKFDNNIKQLVDHRYFQRMILLAILINAISMGIEYHNQPEQLTEAVEISNIVFSCLFLIEMILKLMAHGVYNYIIDGFNCFDGCIVIISILELFESSSGSGLSVLRTFRLLRILKLVRFMPALRRQLLIMLRTLDNVAVFFALLVLFIFIFSILGMNLFGCKFCETLPDGTDRCDRKNFNSLLWSLVTVFQILTQEDWNVVLFNGMEKTSHWAALYFVLLMTFGNYVLFNLLVAILVEGFSQEDDFKVSSSSSYTISKSAPRNPLEHNNIGGNGGSLNGADSQNVYSPYQIASLDQKSEARHIIDQASIVGRKFLVEENSKVYGKIPDGSINDNRLALSIKTSARSSICNCPNEIISRSDSISNLGQNSRIDSYSINGSFNKAIPDFKSTTNHLNRGNLVRRVSRSTSLSQQRCAHPCFCSEIKPHRTTTTATGGEIDTTIEGPTFSTNDARPSKEAGGLNNWPPSCENIITRNNKLTDDYNDSIKQDGSYGQARRIDMTSSNLSNASQQSIELALGEDGVFVSHGQTVGNLKRYKQTGPKAEHQMDATYASGGNKGCRRSDDGTRKTTLNNLARNTNSNSASNLPSLSAALLDSEFNRTVVAYNNNNNFTNGREQQTVSSSTSSLAAKAKDGQESSSTRPSNSRVGDKLINLHDIQKGLAGNFSLHACENTKEFSVASDQQASELYRDKYRKNSDSAPGNSCLKLSKSSTTRTTGEVDWVRRKCSYCSNCKHCRNSIIESILNDDDFEKLGSSDRIDNQTCYEEINGFTNATSNCSALEAMCLKTKHAIGEAELSLDSQQKFGCENQSASEQNQMIKNWQYRQLVTSVMEEVSAINQVKDSNYDQSLAYLGLRRPPKKLVYFYDINDDVEEELDFLTESLETKSYATSMLGQHDHYLNNISKSQAAAARIKAVNKMQAHRLTLRKAEEEEGMHIKALALDSLNVLGSQKRSDSLEKRQTMMTVDIESSSFTKRHSQISITAKTRDSSSGNSSNLVDKHPNIELILSPIWSSMPSHLNEAGISMMRFYQTSFANNLYLGKRERAVLREKGHFDRSCCRNNYRAYQKALDAFIPDDNLDLKYQNYPMGQKQQRGDSEAQFGRDLLIQAPDKNDLNLSAIYEPFKLFPSIAGSAMDSTRKSFSGSHKTAPTREELLTKSATMTVSNRRHVEFLRSLENYVTAVSRYEEQQLSRKRHLQQMHERSPAAMTSSGSNLNRTTQALRRGSVVVLSKLKLLQHNQHNHHQSQDHSNINLDASSVRDSPILSKRTHFNSINNKLPRLSLTKVDSSGDSDLNQPHFNSFGKSLNLIRDISDVAINMSSNESLTISPVQSTGISAEEFDQIKPNEASSTNATGANSALNQIVDLGHIEQTTQSLSRHSIANLPDRSSAPISETNTLLNYPNTRPASYTPNLAAKHQVHRPSLINWIHQGGSQSKRNSQMSNPNRNSCFSQTSKTTSIITEKCTDLLKPNLRRRRSFSGPLEWLQDEHRKANDLMLTPVKKQPNKKRIKKIKPQKSNSSDYHSLNNRRVYRLDSRGFQTKLKGTFYVIAQNNLLNYNMLGGQPNFNTVDLAIADLNCHNNDSIQRQFNRDQASKAMGEKDNTSSNELESSFFNTSNEENSLNERQLSSRDTNCRSTNSKIQPKRVFLRYFHWSQWMMQRRHYSLFIFSPKSRVRRFCNAITSRKEFDYFVLFFIAMNCITLAMERPKIPPWSKEREFLTIANYYFTFMFTLEMALKVIAKGLYYGKDAYFKDSWNVMDGSLVGFSLFDLLLSIVADRSPRIFAILRVFRLLRSLRPLRVINRLMGLKLVVQTLLLSLRPIGNIVLICCTFFIIFGILGVQLFKGTFYYCNGPDPIDIMRNVRTKEDCLNDYRNKWINRKYNFDNLGQALMALFVLSSKDGWVNIMYTGLDAVGVDMQPRENYNEWRLLYFISFLLLVAFFVLNMFVGVVVENFHRCRKEQELEEKARRAEKRQRKLDKRRRKIREPPYYSNYGKFRLLLHKWVTGGYFDLLIAAVIGFNVVFMSLEHYQMPDELIHVLKISNYVFTVAFILEAAIKSTALGMKRYLKDRWNQLDVMIVAMSIIGIIFEEMDSFTLPINPTLLRVLRVMRIARVLKLLKMAKGIRALLDTVMQALPQVGNLGLLFFLLFFIFAALGVELFGRLECNDDYPCSGLMDQHAHFQNFGLAFLTLFRVATGDNWNGIMKDTLRDKCDPSSNCLKNCCVSQIIAPLYFVVFVLLAQFVLVNVVVAVLMKHLEESHHEMEIDEEYELDKQLAEELEAKKRALLEAKERQNLYWI